MLVHAAQLIRSRSFIVAASLVGLVAIVCVFFKLAGTLGYESALILSIPAALAAALIGIQSVHTKDVELHAFPRWGSVLLACAAALLPAALLLTVAAVWRPQCNFRESLAWWALIPAGTMVFSAAWGMALGTVLHPRRGWATAAFGLLIIVSLARMTLRMIDGPVLYGYNHFFGYLPGPLYDDVLDIPFGLVFFRLLSLGMAASLVACLAIYQRGRGHILAAILLVSTAVLWSQRGHFRIDADRADVQEALGGKLETEHFIIYWDANAGTSDQTVEDIAHDHEYRYSQIAEFLQIEPKQKIRSYVFHNKDRKKELVGAAQTQVANPWRQEIYIDGPTINHNVLKHELVHAFSGDFGWRVFGFSSAMGLIEGIAVATDWTSSGSRNPHRAAAVMLSDETLPDPDDLLSIPGFYAERPSRAYPAMGSFVRYLVDTYGIEKFREAYPWADFDGVYEKSIDELNTEWRAYLQPLTETLTDGERAIFRARFESPSIFERTCVRTASRIQDEAWNAHWAGAYVRAERKFKELADIDEGREPWKGLAHVYFRWGRLDQAQAALEGWKTREAEGSYGAFVAREFEGDLHWGRGNYEQAKAAYKEVYAKHLSNWRDRQLTLKLAALEDDGVADAARALFLRDRSASAARLRLLLADRSGSGGYAASYLLGRHLFFEKEYEQALGHLQAADRAELTDPALVAELYILTGRTLFRLKEYDSAIRILERVREIDGVAPQTRADAADWVERAKWVASQS